MIEITISHGYWGHLTNLADWSGGKVFDNPPEGHQMCPGIEDGSIFLGVSDRTILGQTMGHDFQVRPFDAEDPEEQALEAKWMANRVPLIDHYIAIQNGCPQPEAFTPMDVYGDRVFVNGEDEDGKPVLRHVLLKHLAAIGIKSNPLYWEPVQIYHGSGYGGIPLFHRGLMSHVDYGTSWYETNLALKGKLPKGYKWDTQGQQHYNYGFLLVEEEEVAHA